MDRCAKWDLPVDQCAHCTGATITSGLVPDWTTTNPVPLPAASPAPEPEPVVSLGWYSTPMLREISDLYLRLYENLPAESRGRNDDNAAAYAPPPDPKRLPVRVEVLDLRHRIESEIPDLARSVCDAMGTMRCIAFPQDSEHGRPEISPRVVAGLATLDRHWCRFEEVMPQMAAEVAASIEALSGCARRVLGDTAPPVPLATPCPSCGLPTVFRLHADSGSVAVCGNPDDLDEYGRRRQWSETEWEDVRWSERSVYRR